MSIDVSISGLNTEVDVTRESSSNVDPTLLLALRGEKGDKGDAATIAVGTVTTGAAGSSASVVNSGTSSAAVFDFTIPKGDTGSVDSITATDPITYSSQTIGFDNTNTDYQSGSQVSSAISTAVGNLSSVATSGDYDDLTNKPTIPTYGLSIASNVITMTGSDGSTSSVTLPVYNGGTE